MVLRFEQTHRQPRPAYAITRPRTGETLGGAEASDPTRPTLTVGGTSYELDVPGRTARDPENKKQALSPVFSNGTECGSIEICFVQTKKILFLSVGYDYRRVILDGTVLTAYEVGLGHQQHYWCIYREDRELVAMLQKDDGAINNCNTYTLYLEENALAAAVCLLALFEDCTQYPDMGEVNGYSAEAEAEFTTQKVLLAKYDADFIPRVIARDGN